MENINISLGIELDKSQFNDNYVQGQVDKATGNVKVKVGKVEIGDVSKDIQNDISKEASKVKVQIKNVDINKDGIEKFAGKLADALRDYNEVLSGDGLKISGDIVDKKDIEKQFRDSIRNMVGDAADMVGIDFDKISITGVRGAATKVSNEFNDIVGSKLEINVGNAIPEVQKVKDAAKSLKEAVEIPTPKVEPQLNELENQLKATTDRVDEELNVLSGKIANKFKETFSGVASDITKSLSDNVKLDFGSIEVVGLEDKIAEINKKINDGMVIEPAIIPTAKVENNQTNIPDAELNALKNNAVKEYAKKHGLEYSEEFSKAFLEGIKSGNIKEVFAEIQKEADESVSKMYSSASQKTGTELLKHYNEYIKRVKESLGGNKINITDALLSDEEVSDLKTKFGRIFTLVEKDGVQLGRVIGEIKDISNSFGIDFDDRVLQNALTQLANIVDIKRQLTKDKSVIPLQLVNPGFNESEYYKDLEKNFYTLVEQLGQVEQKGKDAFKTLKSINEVSFENIDDKNIVGNVERYDELNKRLQDIRETATEISTIKYAFDENNELSGALITYRDELGRVVNETLRLKQLEDGSFDFASKLTVAAESFPNITAEAEKFNETLDKISNNGLVDESKLEQSYLAVSNLKDNINKLDTENARKEIESLKDEISSLSLMDSLLTKLDTKSNLRDAMGIDTDGLDVLKEKIQSITVDTPVKEIERLKTAISRLGAGNNQIISLTTTMEHAIDSFEKFGDVTDVDGYEKFTRNIQNAETVIKELQSGAIKSTDDVKKLTKALNENIKDIEGVKDKKISLTLEVNKLEEKSFLDESVIGNLRSEIEKLNTTNAEEMFKKLSTEIDNLGSREKEIAKIQSAIDSTNKEVGKLYDKNVSLFDTDKVRKDVDTINEAMSSLKNFQELLRSREGVNLGEVSGSIQELERARDTLNSTIDSQKKLNELTEKQNKLRKSLDGLAGLIDASEVEGIRKAIDGMTVENMVKEFKDLNDQIKSFGKSETQLARVDKVMAEIESKMAKLQNLSDSAWNNDASTDKIEKVTNSLSNLASVREKLVSGESVNSINLASDINALNSAYKELNETITTIVGNENKVDDLQKKLNASLEKRTELGVDTEYVKSLIQSLKDIDLASDGASIKIKELHTEINSLGKSDTNIEKVKSTINELNKELNKIDSSEALRNLMDSSNLGRLADDSDIRKIQNMRNELDKLTDVLKELENGATYTGNEIQSMCNDASNSIKELNQTADDVGSTFSGLGEAINKGTNLALGFEFVGLVKQQIAEMKDQIVGLDNEMVSLKRVANETSDTYDKLAKDANKTAVAMGKTTQEVVYSTAEFVKMGYGVEEASDSLSKAALTLSNVADMDIDSSVGAIVSTMKGLDLSSEMAMEIVDVINEAGNKFALESSDLADGIRIGAASLSIAGNDLYETAALITAGCFAGCIPRGV